MKPGSSAGNLHANLSALTVGGSVAIMAYVLIFGPVPAVFAWIFLGVAFSKYMARGYARSVEVSLSVALISLFIVPTALSMYVSGTEFLPFVAAAELFSSALLAGVRAADGRPGPSPPLNASFRFSQWALLLAMVAVGWNLGFDLNSFYNILFFSAPYAISLVLLERSVERLSKTQIYFIIGAYAALMLYYSVFFWSGFGRLVIAGFVMMPILLINQHRDIGLRVWQLGIVTPVTLLGAFILRFKADDLERLGEDSWSSHLTLTVELAQTVATRQPPGFAAYLDQYKLFFLQWVPRDFWPSKPLGVGLSFVDDWMGRTGVSESHSVALGFIGESLWYLGAWFPIAIGILLLSVLGVRTLASRLGGRSYAPVCIVDALLPSLFWGGMATYGSRLWFCLIPALLAAYLLRPRVTALRIVKSA